MQNSMIKQASKMAALLGALAIAGAAQADQAMLTKLDDKQVLDSGANLAWASDWNLAQTSGFDSDGLMTWSQSLAWIAKLNADNYAGHNNWRLPYTITSTSSNAVMPFYIGGVLVQEYGGFHPAGSEMGHLFYEVLGGKFLESILTQTGDSQAEKDNLALFKNVQSDGYWSGTEYPPHLNAVLYFHTNYGTQYLGLHEDNSMYALAVRPADVPAVPEPQTYAMLLAGLGLMGLVARRRR